MSMENSLLEKDKVTVIIPIYKVERYLYDSVQSVIGQSYINIEIILVDDGSPDRCPKMCDELARKYRNVTAIHKENGGLSSARNAGLNAINNTKYILFLDSDDQLERNAIEGMVKAALTTGAEMVVPDRYTKVDERSGNKHLAFHFPKAMYTENPQKFALNVLIEQGRAWRASALLYSYDLIRRSGAKFPVGHIAEDISFNLIVLSYAKKITIYPHSTLNYLKRAGSISNTFQEHFEENIWYIDQQVYDFLNRNKCITDDNLEKRDALLCRNIVRYLFSIMSKKNNLSWEEKNKKAKCLLEDPKSRNVVRNKHIIPYFESRKVRVGLAIIYKLLYYKQDKLAFLILSRV